MEITARLTANAEVKKVKDKEVVNFTVVINDSYKTKDGKKKVFTTYIHCSFWQSTKIAQYLTKSTVVTVTGRIDVNSYKAKDGEFHAKLVFHTSRIKIISGGLEGTTIANRAGNTKVVLKEIEDLPF